ncbi:MAG: helix-turn-helix transcriptional regulator, partial [Paracoccaceae bacterium]
VENPAGLSRSEYRICCLIQEGMAAKNIANQLNIQESTVRSHLHSIYSKTEISGQMELLHSLSRDQIGRGTSGAISA